ncbi:MAG: serine hydrolase domain-containing protein [Ekhidna sp.]|uniref:serine hydrolase domain-containing protein n=1 Tax=Ekhidna sp. TaxID=2608089 RepID=UPI0032ED53BC
MKKLNRIILISIAVCTSSISFSQTKSDSLLNAYLEKSKAVGIVAGYTSDSKKWISSAGYKNLSNQELLEVDTRIRIASITKTMTAVAILQLAESGKINLDVSIDSYFDGVSDSHGKITIRQLLNHSSGIRAYKSSKERENKLSYENLEHAYSIVKDDPLEIEPGSTFSYSSYGYVLLGIIIEESSGLSYEEYLAKNIWEPLEMSSTGVEYLNVVDQSFSELYHKSSNGKVKMAKIRTNLSDRIPAGGVYSTVGDVLLFGEGILNGKLISKESFNEMITDSGLKKEGNPYGFGVYLYGENPKYGNVVGHSGTQIGASAQLMLLTNQKAAVFVASNTSGVWEDMFYLNLLLFSEVCK